MEEDDIANEFSTNFNNTNKLIDFDEQIKKMKLMTEKDLPYALT